MYKKGNMATCMTVVRESTHSPEQLRNQEMVIDPFVKSKGWQCLGQIVLLEVPRNEMRRHVRERVFRKVEELKPDYLVYRDHDRIGFKDGGEIGWFVTELGDRGTRIVTADDGMIYDMADITVMVRAMSNALVSHGEITKKAFRTHGGRQRTVRESRSVAGQRVPFGSIGRCSAKMNNDWVYDDHLNLWVMLRNRPQLATGGRKTWVQNEERAALVREMYSMADQPTWHTPAEIARKLNQAGKPPYPGEPWDGPTVKGILSKGILCSDRWRDYGEKTNPKCQKRKCGVDTSQRANRPQGSRKDHSKTGKSIHLGRSGGLDPPA